MLLNGLNVEKEWFGEVESFKNKKSDVARERGRVAGVLPS